MRRVLTRIIYLAIAAQLLAACVMTPSSGQVTDQISVQNQHTASAASAFRGLTEIDAVVKLNNQQLSRQITRGLKSQADSSGDYYFKKLRIQFGQQAISLVSTVDIADNTGNVISAIATGDVLLDYSGNRLVWFPLFKHLRITSTDFSFEKGTYAEAIPELNELLLNRLNTDISNALVLHDNNSIPVNVMPLAEVEVGASLPGLGNATARSSMPLNGVFVVVGSAMLIDRRVTTIAMDMKFIPDLSTCPADIEVTRAVFAHEITSREPVGLVRTMTDSENLRYFYSEISGADRPMTIIHYWFADGKPVSVQELAIGPSERWRTWSAKGPTETGVSHWEVLVVEKESGCILHSQSVRTLAATAADTQSDPAPPNQTFAEYRRQFDARIGGFSISKDKPKIALVEIRRSFLQDVFKASVADLHIEAEFDPDTISQLQFAAQMLPFDTREVVCEQQGCPTPMECTASVTQCKRIRDTRDCSSCLFHNPLNNRCVSQAMDPICEAARNRQNAKYDADREACVANVAAENMDCIQRNVQQARSCEIESGTEASICETVKTGIETLAQGSILAGLKTTANTVGTLSVVYSHFRIEDDFSRLKLDISLKSDLEVNGELNFSPEDIPPPLRECISAWNAPFASRAASVATADSIRTDIDVGATALTASWSGFAMPLAMTPSPLESVFVLNPQLLASCGIGLTVEKVEELIVGEDAEFFTGRMKLEIQPLPTRIKFSPATVIYGDTIYQAQPVLGDEYLRYDIEK